MNEIMGNVFSKLKEYISSNISMLRKFWVNQIAISLLGIMITWPMSIVAAKYASLGVLPELAATLFCGGFFCCLIYDNMYELGAKDYVRSLNGKERPSTRKALKITMLAYSPTVLVATLAVIFFVLDIGNAYGVTSVILNMVIHAMYSGLFFVLPARLSTIAFPISILITVSFACLGYFLASHDKTLRGLLGFAPKQRKE